MQPLVAIALYAWIPLTVILFWIIPPRRAAIVSLLAGWMFLPLAAFGPGLIDEPWGAAFMCLAYPSRFFLTKASVIGAAVLLGAAVGDGRRFLSFRPRWFDLPLAVWCLVPVLSAAANGLPLGDGMRDAAYLLLAWGGPYVMGRLYLTDGAGLRDFANGVIIAGLVYVPICVIEMIMQPMFYSSVYGTSLEASLHPWEMDGAERWIGWRALGFLEHGNQLGIWLAGAAVISIWMWRAKARPVLGGWGAALLAMALLLSQSVGPVLLASAALAGQQVLPRVTAGKRRAAGIAAACAVVVLALALTVGARPLRRAAIAMLGEQRVMQMREVARFKSLGSRWSMAAESAEAFRAKPLTGWGQWDWYRHFKRPPWSLALLAQGMGGALALAAMMAVFIVPAAMFFRRFDASLWNQPLLAAPAALAAVLAMMLVDNLLNPTFNVVMLAAVGGLAAGSARSVNSSSSAQPVQPAKPA